MPFTVDVRPSLVRVGPHDTLNGLTTQALSAAKGEYQSFQIIIQASAGALMIQNVTASDLTDTDGNVIPNSNITLYRENYLTIANNEISPTAAFVNPSCANCSLGGGDYPDGLIPFVDPATGAALSGGALQAVPSFLAANTNQPFWVDVYVPRSATAGAYHGTFTVATNVGSVQVRLNLQVWNFTLPATPSLKSSFGVWAGDSTRAQAINRELLRNRVMPGQHLSVSETSALTPSGLNGVDLGFFSGADQSNCSVTAGVPTVQQITSAAAPYPTGIYLYDYSFDEITYCPNLFSTVQQWAAHLHQAGIDNLVTMAPTAGLLSDGTGSGRSAVDIWVMLPKQYDPTAAPFTQALAKGDRLWSYETLVQDSYSPKWLLDFSPINFRINGLINQSLGYTGMLYWRVDDWAAGTLVGSWATQDFVDGGNGAHYPGEGNLVYPGEPAGMSAGEVAPSMRLKWIRDGVQDYEYVQLLKNAGYGPQAMAAIRPIASDWSHWTMDPNALEAVRTALAALLEGPARVPLNPPADPKATLSHVRVYPNPARPSQGSTKVTFDGMPANSTVKIFTVSGHLLATLGVGNDGIAHWPMTTKSGDAAASGIYIYLITDGNGDKARGEFALIR